MQGPRRATDQANDGADGELELFHGSFWADPYPAYSRLRSQAPVHKMERPDGPVWLLTRHGDVSAALTDPRLSRDWRLTLPEEHRAEAPADPMPMMILMDPPDHTRLRALVSRSFTARRMAELQPRVQQIADDLLAGLPETGTVDLMHDYAFPLPVQVICELLGVPSQDRDAFGSWTQQIMDAGSEQDRLPAMGQLAGYLSELIERKRSEPDEALLSALLQVSQDETDRLTPQELVGMAMLLLIAGHETTVGLIGNAVLALLTHPAQLAVLRARPELIDDAVEEFLRWDSPVAQPPIRFATQDLEYSGVTVPAGSKVMLGLAAANRDRIIALPDELDIERDTSHTSGAVYFGAGAHYCLGAPLARIEARVAIGSLIADRPHLALATDPAGLSYRHSMSIRGLTALPVTVGARA